MTAPTGHVTVVVVPEVVPEPHAVVTGPGGERVLEGVAGREGDTEVEAGRERETDGEARREGDTEGDTRMHCT